MTGECGIEDGIVHCEAKAWDVRENRCDGKEKYVETGGTDGVWWIDECRWRGGRWLGNGKIRKGGECKIREGGGRTSERVG